MDRAGALLAGKYRLERRLGGGGMGEVWLATDERLDRPVAVKVMRPALVEDPAFRQRFRVEARAMAKIAHPGVVTVHDFDEDASGAFLVMEYVAGDSLSAVLSRDTSLPQARTMELIAQAAEALQAAHDCGIIHRDVKPANLLIRTGGRVVLTDFGIVRMLEGTHATLTGMLLGTLSYLAPEQVLGEPATAQSDLYALGVVAYECLTGIRPFDRDNPAATMISRTREPPPTLAAPIAPPVCAVLEQALATDPADRWPSAKDLAEACRRAITPTPIPSQPPAAGTIRAVAGVPTAPSPPVHTTPATWKDTAAAPGPTRSSGSPAKLWSAVGIDPIMIALPGYDTGGYTLRTTHSVLSKSGTGDNAPTFLSHRHRLQVFATAEALVSFVRSGEPHDLMRVSGWRTVVRTVRPKQIAPADHDIYELDLVVENLRGGHDAWDAALLVAAGELARDLGHALGLQRVLAALEPGFLLDDVDDALRAVGIGLMFARRRLRRFNPRQVGLEWEDVIAHISGAVDWYE